MVDVVSKTHEHYVLFCGAMHVSVPIRVAQRVCVCVHVLSVGSNKEFGKVPARKFPSRPTWLPCAVHELAALLLTCAVTAPSKVLLLTCAVMPVEGFRLMPEWARPGMTWPRPTRSYTLVLCQFCEAPTPAWDLLYCSDCEAVGMSGLYCRPCERTHEIACRVPTAGLTDRGAAPQLRLLDATSAEIAVVRSAV